MVSSKRSKVGGNYRRGPWPGYSVAAALALIVNSLAGSPDGARASEARVASQYASLDAWMKREALPLDTSKGFDASVDKVMASLGPQVELLGFGETMHGSEEILQLRNRFFQRLVEKHGYSAIAIESGFPEIRHVNDYIAGSSEPEAEAAAKGIGWAFGTLKANQELIQWMRQYNADPSHKVKLHFYGFDVSAMGNARVRGADEVLHLAIEYLASIDSTSAQAQRQRIDTLLSKLSGWENADVWTGKAKAPGLTPEATELRIATEDLISELRVRRPELVAKSNEDSYLLALRYAQIARETLNFHAALARTNTEPPLGLRGVRDAWMADTLRYIVEREKGRGKVLAYAGQGHLRRDKVVWPCCGQKYRGTDIYAWWPAGSQLNATLGARYALIGTAVGVSEENGIARPEPDTFEARLMAQPGAATFFRTRRGRGLPAPEIAATPLRSGSLKNLTYSGLTSDSFTDFDWLVFLDSSTYNRGGPSLDGWGKTSSADSTTSSGVEGK